MGFDTIQSFGHPPGDLKSILYQIRCCWALKQSHFQIKSHS